MAHEWKQKGDLSAHVNADTIKGKLFSSEKELSDILVWATRNDAEGSFAYTGISATSPAPQQQSYTNEQYQIRARL